MSDKNEENKDQNQNQNNSGDQQNGGDKIQKEHKEVLKILAAIVGGDEKMFPKKKLTKGSLPSIVAELFKEDNIAKREAVKLGLKELLKKFVEFKNAMKEEKAKLEKAEQQKTKEFNEAARKFFATIEDDGLDADYISALEAATKA